ncbi:MAG: diguanylate cyclase [Lachnospiraceae bacterium]|nr:diguanylate cyclase [Lachnospiraceae bacterium]
MYYSGFGMLALVIHIIINFRDLKKRPEGEMALTDKRYRKFLFSLIIYYLADICWGLFYAMRIIPLTYFDTALFFASMGLTVYLWMRYIIAFLKVENALSGVLTWAGAGILAFQIITLGINFFLPIVFEFNENNEYVPGKARYIMLAVQVVLFAGTAVVPLFRAGKRSRKDRLHYNAIGLSGIVMTIFIILQTFDPYAPYYAIGCLVATCIIHSFIEVDEKEERDRQLGSVRRLAYKDALTNVKNNRAYDEARAYMDRLIRSGELKEFGIVVFDLNNLKKVNDTLGHDAGDRYIQKAGRLICNTFKHSPVYRIGGDEFIAFLEGEDFRNREELLYHFNRKIEDNLNTGGVVISAGLDILDPAKDQGYDTIFERADSKMYERKKKLKSRE